MLAVTTFSPEGYLRYGKRCIENLVKYFPGKVVAFYEEKPDLEGVEFRDLFQIKDLKRWIDRVKRHPGSDGHGPSGYDFRYDAQRFCLKVFVQDAVFDEDQYIFWFDADCIIYKDFTEEFLRGLLEGFPFCYMGRSNALGLTTYTETGFLGFNTKHEKFPEFRSRYLQYLMSGKIFSQLKGWHDCIAFDHAREGIKGNNLTPKGTRMNHVIKESVLSQYMDHLKGNRKFERDIRLEPVSG